MVWMLAPGTGSGHSILAVKFGPVEQGSGAPNSGEHWVRAAGREPPVGSRRYLSCPRNFPTPTDAPMGTPERYDAIVIGAGQAGVPLARELAGSGRRTAVVEREHVGGTCINEGCTPTKTMVASARVAYLVRRAADYGVTTGQIGVDMGRVRERKRAIVKSFRSGSVRRLEATPGLDLICADARFTGPRRLA